MNTIELGDVLHCNANGVIVAIKIYGEPENKYSPPVGSADCIIVNPTRWTEPQLLNFSDGCDVCHVTVYNWPDELERHYKIGELEPTQFFNLLQNKEEINK